MHTSRIPHIAFGLLGLLLPLKVSPPAGAQPVSLSNASSVSVLTMLPGGELYSAWGHTAIRVTDSYAGLDVTFNYGTFDFNQPNFYLKFVRGQLDYELSAASFEQTLQAYRFLERAVIEQQLDLTLEQRNRLFERLQYNYLPENRAYRYDFFFDNCSTRPRDILENTLALRIGSNNADPNAESFRRLLKPGLVDKPWTAFGIDLVLGLPSDRLAAPRERLFLPLELLTALDTLHIGDGTAKKPFVLSTDTLFWPQIDAHRPARSPGAGLLTWLIALGWASLVLIGRRRGAVTSLRRLDAALFLLLGVAGALMLLLWMGTDHTVTARNLNLLWAWPTHLWAAFRLTGHRKVWLQRYWWSATAVCLLVLVLWPLWPQHLPSAAIPILLLVAFRAADRGELIAWLQRPRSEEK